MPVIGRWIDAKVVHETEKLSYLRRLKRKLSIGLLVYLSVLLLITQFGFLILGQAVQVYRYSTLI